MKLEMNDKGNIELDVHEIITELIGNTPDEELDDLISMFGFQKRISKMVSEALAKEFSRENYNTNIHECRDLFLKHIKQEEIKFYASLIANHVENYKRDHENYWKLYHWCSNNNLFQGREGYPSILHSSPIDFDFRKELEAEVVKAFAEKFPDTK